jgi:hypothetical protein
LEITAIWGGEADVDLMVIEPRDLLCSSATTRTINGGVWSGSIVENKERYVAQQATSGHYEIMLRKVWGEPTSSVVNVDVVFHRGTPNERRERYTIPVTETLSKPVKISLEAGRRTSPAALVAEERWVIGKNQSPSGRPLAKLRELARIRQGGLNQAGGGAGAFGGNPNNGGDAFFQIGAGVGNGAVAFQPIIQTFPDGTFLTAQAVVSADRRYVRMNMVPAIQLLESDFPRTIPVSGTAGGGFFGGS